jgi:hypothetical protein
VKTTLTLNQTISPYNKKSITEHALTPGDILLYSKVSDGLPNNIADATNGFFHHAALYLGKCPTTNLSRILHTGPAGAKIDHENLSLPTTFDGVFVVRTNTSININKLNALALSSVGIHYDYSRLPFVGLAAWDRRCFVNGSMIFKPFTNKFSRKIITRLNREGSHNVCSGLTLDILSQSIAPKLFTNACINLSQMSPNCIWQEATLDKHNFSTYCLEPISTLQLQRKKRSIFRASLSLAVN